MAEVQLFSVTELAALGGPLQAGSYSAWIQQVGASTDYSFTLKTAQLTPPYGLTATATSVNEGAMLCLP